MALTPKFTNAQLTAELERRMAMIEQAILSRLVRIGEQFVTNARERGTYQDQTGNLRNSIGYVVLKNGQQWQGGGFSSITVNADGRRRKDGSLDKRYKSNRGKSDTVVSDGANAGKKVIGEAAVRYPTGYVLIVVAGMDYAAAVESKGRDVLSGSAPDAVQGLKEAMAAITGKVQRMR